MKKIKPPIAKKIKTIKKIHNIKLVDEYAWLKADNWQEIMQNPTTVPANIKQYLEAENDYCKKIMQPTKQLQNKLFNEMKARIKQNDSSVPDKYGKFYYQLKYNKNKEYPIYTRKAFGGKQEILFNGNLESRRFDYFDVASIKHSPNHKHIAWAFDGNGSEFYCLKIRNIKTNKIIDEINNIDSFVWAADSQTIIYAQVDENHRPNKIIARKITSKKIQEKIIFYEKDQRFFCFVKKSLDGKTILIHSSMNDEDEIMFLDAKNPNKKPKLISKREKKHEYNVKIENNKLFILTNKKAENFQIMIANKNKPQQKHWQIFVPHKKNVIIKDFIVLKNHLIRLEKTIENALPRIVIKNIKTKNETIINFKQSCYALSLYKSCQFNTTCFRFSYSSMATPQQIWQYDIKTNKRKLLKQQKIPSQHNEKNYTMQRLYAPAKDGEKIPISIIYHNKTKLNATAPCLLYGYGSYGLGLDASFSSQRFSLINRGFIYAIAHIRGGDDKGKNWYTQTKKHGKIKTFQDFIDCGKYLTQQKFTAPKKIIAQGGSAGGLLMGAIANMEKNLWGGIIAQVPFVDILNTMLDDKLPLTPGEWSQWGNPIKSKKEFEIIKNYSPYDNIQKRTYPPMLVMGGLTDPRVQYWEPAKWVAKLRAKTKNKNIILLSTNMQAGHFGETGRFARLKELAMIYSFILKVIK